MSSEPTSMLDTWKSYISNVPMVTELIFCFLLAASGHFIPGTIFRISLHERDVPYQLTDNGDVILSSYINNPYVEEETIPDWLLVVLAMLVPLIFVLVTGLKSSIENDLHSSLCALLFTIGSTEIITGSIKLYCGYLRPNFYEFCEFDTDSLQCLSERSNPRKSFPSGHSSMSLCSATILTLILLGRIGTHRIDDDIETYIAFASRYIKKRCLSILATFPMLLGIFIAVSRVHDDRHHPADVVAGSMIGIGCALFSYHLWYPSIYSSRAGMPVQAPNNFTQLTPL
eukprot:CAMPEP_0204616512 /NCGR_PEP_ID=MMETSP0717-20131115/3736_1 /ASSEMBLY_ACC=CAM_ASM_000666 /TAXON_ID=230516 /ORGANISM="Chaetoceros curvisetus" /LENGTH=284 /DNA_ID=CAMNT_0051629769 /DNA_START=82 /DNA_END=936 /DNA_ORIENTATION=+